MGLVGLRPRVPTHIGITIVFPFFYQSYVSYSVLFGVCIGSILCTGTQGQVVNSMPLSVVSRAAKIPSYLTLG